MKQDSPKADCKTISETKVDPPRWLFQQKFYKDLSKIPPVPGLSSVQLTDQWNHLKIIHSKLVREIDLIG